MPLNLNPPGTQDRWTLNLIWTLRFLAAWLAGGFCLLLVCVSMYFAQDPNRVGLTKGLAIFCHGSLLSVAFAAVGGLIGFLFGIPRQAESSSENSAKAGQGSDAGAGTHTESKREVNTNLEQVSDWLTKIILGAGLTQLVKLPGQLKSLGDYFKGGFDGSQILPLMIVMNSLIFGFFAGYLITQLFLAKALIDAAKAVTDVDVALTAAGNLEKSKQFGAATATLEGALLTLGPDTPKVTKRNLFEQLTYNALYDAPPDGFLKAIRYAEQYLREEPNNPSARIWVNLAAALSQKYKWDVGHGAPKQALDETRKRALEAARNAMAIEPQMKGLLRMLWNPSDPTKVSAEEDDLEVFFDDPDFKNLLG